MNHLNGWEFCAAEACGFWLQYGAIEDAITEITQMDGIAHHYVVRVEPGYHYLTGEQFKLDCSVHLEAEC